MRGFPISSACFCLLIIIYLSHQQENMINSAYRRQFRLVRLWVFMGLALISEITFLKCLFCYFVVKNTGPPGLIL